MPKFPNDDFNGGNGGNRDNGGGWINRFLNSPGKIATFAVGGALLLATAFTSIYTVKENERALTFRFNKLASETVVGPGLNFKAPFVDSVQRFRIDQQSLNVQGIETYTKDNQPVNDAHVVVNYRIPANQLVKVVREFPDYQQRLQTLTIDRFKRVLGQQQAVEIASKRNEVTKAVFESVKHEAERLLGVEIVDVQIPDIKLSPQFMAAIEQVAIAKASVEKAEQENQRAKIEAIKAATEAEGRANAEIERAKGEAQAIGLRAKADAERIQLEGKAKADAAEKLADAIAKNPSIVEYKKAEQWNGQLPLVGGGDGVILSLDAEKLAAAQAGRLPKPKAPAPGAG